MRFRPCIDIHNGQVKQIIGGSLKDSGDHARTNFASEAGADYYAGLYKADGLKGGHIILLNPVTSDYYDQTRGQALSALQTYPGGLQIGGGITVENAADYLTAGASHVIVTSYVFKDGEINWERLEKLVSAVGKERIVLDLSCRKKDGGYYIMTDRWQKFTTVELNLDTINQLAGYCDEFLVHGVDVEGKCSGVESQLVKMLGSWQQIPVTYAGGIGSIEDLERFRKDCGGNLDFTIGSALDLFGGSIAYDFIKRYNVNSL